MPAGRKIDGVESLLVRGQLGSARTHDLQVNAPARRAASRRGGPRGGCRVQAERRLSAGQRALGRDLDRPAACPTAARVGPPVSTTWSQEMSPREVWTPET